jgi:hypothetical protein
MKEIERQAEYAQAVEDRYRGLISDHQNTTNPVYNSSGSNEQALSIIRSNPELFEQYFDWVEKTHDIGSVVDFIKNAPEYANNLRPIFTDERKELLRAYAAQVFARLTDTERAADENLPDRRSGFPPTRLSTSPDLAVVQAHLDQNNQWREALDAKFGGSKRHDIETIMGGVITVRLSRIDVVDNNFDPSMRGVEIEVLPTDSEAYGFVHERLKLTETGLIDSRPNHMRELEDLGYMTRHGTIDEGKMIEALVRYDWASLELVEILDQATQKIAD